MSGPKKSYMFKIRAILENCIVRSCSLLGTTCNRFETHGCVHGYSIFDGNLELHDYGLKLILLVGVLKCDSLRKPQRAKLSPGSSERPEDRLPERDYRLRDTDTLVESMLRGTWNRVAGFNEVVVKGEECWSWSGWINRSHGVAPVGLALIMCQMDSGLSLGVRGSVYGTLSRLYLIAS